MIFCPGPKWWMPNPQLHNAIIIYILKGTSVEYIQHNTPSRSALPDNFHVLFYTFVLLNYIVFEMLLFCKLQTANNKNILNHKFIFMLAIYFFLYLIKCHIFHLVKNSFWNETVNNDEIIILFSILHHAPLPLDGCFLLPVSVIFKTSIIQA